MSVALRVCLTLLVLAAVVAGASEAAAQFPIGVDIDDPEVETAVTGEAAVFVPEGADVDAFELELRFDPTTIRVEQVRAAEGWQLIPQSLQVDRNGVINVVGFSVADICSEGPRCDLVILTFVGRESGSAGFRVGQVSLLRSGTELESVSLKPGDAPDPVESLPGDRPDESVVDQGQDSDGSSLATVVLWLFVAAAALVAASSGIVAGSRWLWNRSTTKSARGPDESLTNAEWDGDVEGFLDRVATLGYISFDETAPNEKTEEN